MQPISRHASGAQEVMLDFIRVGDMPGESQRLTGTCGHSFSRECFDSKPSESIGMDNVTPHLRRCSQSIQQRIKRSGRLPCRPPTLESLAMSENANFATWNQVQVEVDFAGILRLLVASRTMGSTESLFPFSTFGRGAPG